VADSADTAPQSVERLRQRGGCLGEVRGRVPEQAYEPHGPHLLDRAWSSVRATAEQPVAGMGNRGPREVRYSRVGRNASNLRRLPAAYNRKCRFSLREAGCGAAGPPRRSDERNPDARTRALGRAEVITPRPLLTLARMTLQCDPLSTQSSAAVQTALVYIAHG